MAATFAITLCWTTAAGGQAKLLGTIAKDDYLIDINRTTAIGTRIGHLGIPWDDAMTGMAYDEVHEILYGINPADDTLYTIDPDTAAATAIGAAGALAFANANGLAYDSRDEILYATDNATQL